VGACSLPRRGSPGVRPDEDVGARPPGCCVPRAHPPSVGKDGFGKKTWGEAEQHELAHRRALMQCIRMIGLDWTDVVADLKGSRCPRGG
jgi:hypothetical protein